VYKLDCSGSCNHQRTTSCAGCAWTTNGPPPPIRSPEKAVIGCGHQNFRCRPRAPGFTVNVCGASSKHVRSSSPRVGIYAHPPPFSQPHGPGSEEIKRDHRKKAEALTALTKAGGQAPAVLVLPCSPLLSSAHSVSSPLTACLVIYSPTCPAPAAFTFHYGASGAHEARDAHVT
jgi:hypothetical protein